MVVKENYGLILRFLQFNNILALKPSTYLQWMVMAVVPLLLLSCGGGNTSTKPVRKYLTQAVYASGKVFPLNYYRATTAIPGQLQHMYVKIGDSVSIGQPLFRIKNDQTELATQNAANNLNLARINAGKGSPYLATYQADIENAKAKFALDSLNFARYSKLRQGNAGTPQQFDQLKTQYEVSRDQLSKAKSALQAAKSKADNDLKNAKVAFQSSQTQQNDFVVTAAVDGVVYDILPKLGEYVAPQVPVMEIGTPGNYEVELVIDESDLNLIKVGQQIVYETEAFVGTYFKGNLTKLYPKISAQTKSVKAIGSINLPDSVNMYAGSTIEANIIYAKRENVLVVPRTLVRKDTVYVKDGIGKKPVKIKTGIYDLEYVEVLEGIDENTELLKP